MGPAVLFMFSDDEDDVDEFGPAFAGCDKPDKERFKSGDQEPWIYRGGLLAEFRVRADLLTGIQHLTLFIECLFLPQPLHSIGTFLY